MTHTISNARAAGSYQLFELLDYPLAIIGMLLSLGFGGYVLVNQLTEASRTRADREEIAKLVDAFSGDAVAIALTTSAAVQAQLFESAAASDAATASAIEAKAKADADAHAAAPAQLALIGPDSSAALAGRLVLGERMSAQVGIQHRVLASVRRGRRNCRHHQRPR